MIVDVVLLLVAVAFSLFGWWGWKHAYELTSASSSARARMAKTHQMRRGAICYFVAAVALVVLTGLNVSGVLALRLV